MGAPADAPNEFLPDRPAVPARRRPGGWLAWVSLGAWPLLLFLAGLWWWSLNWIPREPDAPEPALPSPNAYDLYLRAANQFGPDANRRAVELLPGPSAELNAPAAARARALLREHRGALRTLREGFRHSYQEPLPEVRAGLTSWQTDELRYLDALLRLESAVDAAGSPPRKLAIYLDGLRLGEDMGRGATLTTLPYGQSIAASMREHAWTLLDRLSAEEAAAAAGRLERILERHVPLQTQLETDRRHFRRVAVDYLSNPYWRLRYLQESRGPDWWRAPDGLSEFARLHGCSNRRLLDLHDYWRDWEARQAARPYPLRAPLPPAGDFLTAPLFEELRRARLASAENEALSRMLLLSLALRAHRAERGAPPRRLDELVPRYLRRLPADPFAPDGRFRYRYNGSRGMLYSIGADGRDDRGAPASLGMEGSTGDLVAGVHRR